MNEDEIERELGIYDIRANQSIRPSFIALNEIKERSNENMAFIYTRLGTNCEEQKRDIIVNLISALDYYIHDIIIWGIIEITENNFPKGKNYDKFKLSIKHLKLVFEESEINKLEIRKEIINELKQATYQKWGSIKEGLKIIIPEDSYEKISRLTGGAGGDYKFSVTTLENLNEKRNSIVHNYDRNLHNESIRNEFTLDCKKKFEYISLIIESIHEIILEYDQSQPENQ